MIVGGDWGRVFKSLCVGGGHQTKVSIWLNKMECQKTKGTVNLSSVVFIHGGWWLIYF